MKSECPKCGEGWVFTRYIKNCPPTGEERLEKRCAGCGHTWTTPCADAQAAEEDAARAVAKETP